MNRDIENILKKNKYRSQFYQKYKSGKTHKPKLNKTTAKKQEKDLKLIASFTYKALISLMLLFVLLISQKDERISFLYDMTFRHMNMVKIGNYMEKNFSGIFPTPDNPNKYVNGTYIDLSNSTSFQDGVLVDMDLSEPVLSHVEGIVIQMYKDEDLGRVIVIQDINGHEYHYGYLEDINVGLYHKVERGDILGVGKTKENYSGSYFYLSIKDGRSPLDVVQVVNQ